MMMIGMNKCKLKLKTTMWSKRFVSFVERLQIVEFFSNIKRSSSTKNPVKNESESKPAQSNESVKEPKWSRDIRF